MRVLEWVLSLAFAPILVLPLLAERWRRWLPVAAALPALAGVAQVAAEGWRTQMLPLYALAALVLALRLPALFGRAPRRRPRRAWLGSGFTALGLGLGIGLAAWALPVVRLPEPTGPHPVGIVDRELVDADRGRRLMVSVWYPAAQSGPPVPLFDHPDAVIKGMADSFGVPAAALQHMRYVTLKASASAPVLAEGPPLPIVVFSHGLVGLRTQNSSTFQELASWGYVVVAIDHTDAAAVTVFPDGEAHSFDLARFGIDPADGEVTQAAMDEHVFPVWVADQRFVYDTLERWSADDPLLAGRLDLSQIGSFGHSFGGATALEVCRTDGRCRAAANIDGGLYGPLADSPAVRPLLLMTSAESADLPEAMAKWTRMIENAQAPAAWLELPGSTHLSFTISQLLSPLLVPDGFDPRAGLRITDRYLRAFFDHHLRGVATAPFGPGPADPDVRWRSR